MRRHLLACAILVAAPGLVGASSDTVIKESGGDTFVSGETITQTIDAAGDVFVAGRSTTVMGQTTGDFHAAGFDVVIDTDVGADAYAAGASVTVKGDVAEDLTAAGFSVRTEPASRVGRNARLAGGTVTVNGPVDGAMSIIGRDVVLNAPITGDVRVLSRTLTFGPDAVVSGTLTYSTEAQVDVPARVADPTRVTFEPVTHARVWDAWDEMREMDVGPSTASVLFGFLITLLFFVLVGAIALSAFPTRVSWLRKSIAASPGRTFLLGIAGLSILLGAIPVTAMTIVGLPFVPIAILTLVVIWTLAYALGAYAVAMWLWSGLGGDVDPTRLVRLGVFAAAIVAVALLNFIPFVGWVANYTLVLLGTGAMTHAVFLALVPDPDPVLDPDMQPIEDGEE